jgi:hypothetical protein
MPITYVPNWINGNYAVIGVVISSRFYCTKSLIKVIGVVIISRNVLFYKKSHDSQTLIKTKSASKKTLLQPQTSKPCRHSKLSSKTYNFIRKKSSSWQTMPRPIVMRKLVIHFIPLANPYPPHSADGAILIPKRPCLPNLPSDEPPWTILRQ